MSLEKIPDIMKALSADPKAQELLANAPQPDDQDGEIRVYAEIARQLGYDITEAELKAFMEKTAASVAARTEEAAADIQELPDEVLDQVAGGGDARHLNCKYSFEDKENCWFKDGCDNVFQLYDDYVCKNLYFDDPCHSTAKPCEHDESCIYGFAK